MSASASRSHQDRYVGISKTVKGGFVLRGFESLPSANAGGAGNDTIRAKNGRKDKINCGKGKKDAVVADKGDKVKGCEKVK